MIVEPVQHRTSSDVGEALQPRDERFDFEWCRADDENAQS
jgi:hypothetical protein